jgi:hypothetical protein
MRNRTPIFAFLLLAASTQGFAAPPKACDLLTPQQAQTVIGGHVGPGQETTRGPYNQCEFSDPNQSKAFDVNYVATSVLHLPNSAAAIAIMKQTDGAQTLPGLGEFATYAENTSTYNYDVVVLYHGFMIGLSFKGGGPNPKDAMIAVAKQVLTKF